MLALSGANIPRNVVAPRGYQVKANAVSFSRIEQLNNLIAHPDAIRRRQERERKEAKIQKLEDIQTEQEQSPWWLEEQVPNIVVANSPAEFSEVLRFWQQQGQLVVVKFFAPFCNGCRTMSPKIKQLAQQNPDVVFIKFNAGDESMRQHAEDFGVSKLPFFHIYHDYKCLSAFTANLISIHKLRKQLNACKCIQQGKNTLVQTRSTV
eukprot:TRINITY_DN16295_c0_g1_i4.p2 TRINITY_DN16295_c0_g1~~TRINITY_DN16295_c0_g1_i4.p2  ORF type:complete len:207 (-),score=14.90 TRINITY_DN16295_c0_g1_i4:45-665(-)